MGFRGLSCVSIVMSDYAWKARAIRGRFVRHLESLEGLFRPISPPGAGLSWLHLSCWFSTINWRAFEGNQ